MRAVPVFGHNSARLGDAVASVKLWCSLLLRVLELTGHSLDVSFIRLLILL